MRHDRAMMVGMQFSVTFRHMDATNALKSYARDRLEKIRKYFPDPISCNVVLSSERFLHRVDVNVLLHNGFKVAGTETTENMYSSIDLVAAKIERQVRRYKDKLREHKVRDMPALDVAHSVLADAEEPEARNGEPNDAAAAAVAAVVRKEQVRAEPMTSTEAIMQLNLLHKQFLIFRHDEGGHVCVVYRRGDGEYGLIETGASA